MKTLLDKQIEENNSDTAFFIDWNVDIRDQILYLLENHPDIKNQELLAKKLKKKPSEISRLMSGLHNLTLESLAKIAFVLGFHDLIMTDLRAKEKYANKDTKIFLKIDKSFKIKTQNDFVEDKGIGANVGSKSANAYSD